MQSWKRLLRTYYNRIEGQSLERIAVLSDGIFAVAMTLLVLDLHVPVSTISNPITKEQDLLTALVTLGPNLLHLFGEFFDAGHFLGWTANSAKQFSREVIAISPGSISPSCLRLHSCRFRRDF